MRPDFPLSLRNPLFLTEILADFTDTGRVTLFCDLVEGTLWLAIQGEIRPTRPNLRARFSQRGSCFNLRPVRRLSPKLCLFFLREH